MLVQIVDDLFTMPTTMRHLAVVQFFSWFALFSMWIYTTAAVTSVHYGSNDPTSTAYNDGADWVGLLFAIYNGFAAIAAILIPWVVRKTSLQISHSINLICGAAGLMAFLWIKDPALLWIPMIGVGIAWAAILAMPYAILAGALPPEKTGVYMGIFNATITIPQIVAGFFGGMILLALGGSAISIIALAGGSMALAGILAKVVLTSEGH